MDRDLGFLQPRTAWGIQATFECDNGGENFSVQVAGYGTEPTEAEVLDIVSAAAKRVSLCEDCPQDCMVNQLARTYPSLTQRLKDRLTGKRFD